MCLWLWVQIPSKLLKETNIGLCAFMRVWITIVHMECPHIPHMVMDTELCKLCEQSHMKNMPHASALTDTDCWCNSTSCGHNLLYKLSETNPPTPQLTNLFYVHSGRSRFKLCLPAHKKWLRTWTGNHDERLVFYRLTYPNGRTNVKKTC